MENSFSRMSPLIQTLVQVILPHLDQPFAFFGHSMGALVSFELARQLRKSYGLTPIHLFVSGHRAPQLLLPDAPIHALPEAEFIEKLRNMNGTPIKVLEHAELMELTLPALRADFAVCETYSYISEPPLDCPITAYGGLKDNRVSHGQLEAWRAQTSDSFTLQLFPGDHFFLHSATPLLLRALSQELSKVVSMVTQKLEPVISVSTMR